MCRDIEEKYLGNRSIFQINRMSGSQFWRGLLSIRHWFQRGRTVRVRSGAQTSFWHDTWIGNCPLKIEFDQLYNFCRDTRVTVEQVLGDGHVHVEFRRLLNQQEFSEWERMVERLALVSLCDDRDEMCWAFEKSGIYSTRSLYKALTFGGVEIGFLKDIWKARIPLKIQIFLWMVYHDRIQAAVQLKKRNWAGPEECKLCGELETVDHILFQCPMALFLWVF